MEASFLVDRVAVQNWLIAKKLRLSEAEKLIRSRGAQTERIMLILNSRRTQIQELIEELELEDYEEDC